MQRIRPRSYGVSILDLMDDPEVFGAHFAHVDDWAAWRAFLAALFCQPMDRLQRKLFRQCTGRKHPPSSQPAEAFLVVGRRGGKSFILALIAVFLATFIDWRPFLASGEVATFPVIAADRKQARVILRYVKGLLDVPLLKGTIIGETKDSVDLVQRAAIEVHTGSFRSTRGYSCPAVLCDELAFWMTDDGAADPDREVINALRPAMATFPNPLLLCASSPYARRGVLWDAHRRHYGRENSDVLVWQAASRTMHPSLPQRIVDAAMEDDEASAKAEYYAEFRSDVEQFITRELVQACVSEDVHERAWQAHHHYVGFVDPSGGASDSMTLAIGHREDRRVIVDAIREVKPKFDPDLVTYEFAELLKSYGCLSVTGDKYAGEWPRSRFAAHGVRYELAEKSKAGLYLDALPLLNARQIDLLDHPRLIAQLVSLERRTSRGTGREIVDHPPGRNSHDDVANSVAGLATLLTVRKHSYDSTYSWVRNYGDDEPSYMARWSSVHQRAFGT